MRTFALNRSQINRLRRLYFAKCDRRLEIDGSLLDHGLVMIHPSCDETEITDKGRVTYEEAAVVTEAA